MPSSPAKPFLVPRRDDPQLQRVNESIARLAAVKPAGDAFGAFALAAHLADLAVEAALEQALTDSHLSEARSGSQPKARRPLQPMIP